MAASWECAPVPQQRHQPMAAQAAGNPRWVQHMQPASEETLSRLTPHVNHTFAFKLRLKASAEPEKKLFYLSKVPKESQRERSYPPTPSTTARGPTALLGGSILFRKQEMLLGFLLCSLSEPGAPCTHFISSSYWTRLPMIVNHPGDFFGRFDSFMPMTSWPPDTFSYIRTSSTVGPFIVILLRPKGQRERNYRHSHLRCKKYGFQTSINKWECECWEHKIAQLWVSAEALLFTEHLCVYKYSAPDRAKSWFWY